MRGYCSSSCGCPLADGAAHTSTGPRAPSLTFEPDAGGASPAVRTVNCRSQCSSSICTCEHGVVAVVAAAHDLPGHTVRAVGCGQVDLLGADQDPHRGAARQRLAAPLGRELAEWRVDERAVEDAGDHVGLPDEACQLVIDRPRVEVLRCGALGDLAVAQDSDEVGERECLVLVVGDQQRRGRRFAQDSPNILADA